MRKVLAIVLVALASLQVQASSSVGSITGRAIDVAGRSLANQRIDLVRGGQIVSVSTTDARGSWMFANVAAGDYVVRTSIRGTLAGVRVSVAAGESVAGTTIVVPAAAVSPQFGALASLATSLATAAGTTVASTVATVVSETDATNLSPDAVAAILNALPPEQKQEFAQAVLTVIQDNPNTGNIFATVTDTGSGQTTNTNFNQVIQQIIANPSAPVVISAS